MHNWTGQSEIKGSDHGRECSMCGKRQGINATTSCPGKKEKV